MDYAAFENGITFMLLAFAAMPVATGILVVAANAVFAMFD